ncbi:MAG TPA: SIS domain-containing protein [Patescibacteria group bacterium]|nr:SIS domain-containing protein [Patescibacteria group bacterium]
MTTFNPRAALDPAPDPWADLPEPTTRHSPPFHMTDMIAAEPFLAERLLDRLSDPSGPAGRLAGAIGQAASSGAPIIVTGCGTSEHAAMAAVEILREGLHAGGLPSGPTAIVATQAFELALDPPTGGLVIGISHEGGTTATIRAVEASAAAGARTALITGSANSPAAAAAAPEMVLATVEMDHSWCHTIGYVAPIIAAAAVADELAGRTIDSGLVRDLLASGASDTAGAEAIAAILGECRQIITVGSGADRPAARELALKIEEASWMPATMRDLETFLHGHLPAMDATTGLVLILTDRAERAARVARARQALGAAKEVGIRVAAIVGRDVHGQLDGSLTPAGRLRVDEAKALPAPLAALLGSATPLQLLTERIARVRGTNPDLIRRDDPVYRSAAGVAG